jgi:hypothetical protein
LPATGITSRRVLYRTLAGRTMPALRFPNAASAYDLTL